MSTNNNNNHNSQHNKSSKKNFVKHKKQRSRGGSYNDSNSMLAVNYAAYNKQVNTTTNVNDLASKKKSHAKIIRIAEWINKLVRIAEDEWRQLINKLK